MGSFLSSLSSTLLRDDSNSMEMEPLSQGPNGSQFDADPDRYSRRYPLNSNGHFTTDLLTGVRRRLRVSANKQMPLQDLEPLLTSTNHGPTVLEREATRTSDGSQSGCENINQPLNFKLSELTAFNIDNRDRTIERLRNELKELNEQLRDAQKEIKTLKERLGRQVVNKVS